MIRFAGHHGNAATCNRSHGAQYRDHSQPRPAVVHRTCSFPTQTEGVFTVGCTKIFSACTTNDSLLSRKNGHLRDTLDCRFPIMRTFDFSCQIQFFVMMPSTFAPAPRTMSMTLTASP